MANPHQIPSSEGLASELKAQKNLMVAVATGGPRIDDVNVEYIGRRNRIRDGLARLGIPDANPYPYGPGMGNGVVETFLRISPGGNTFPNSLTR